MQEAAEFGYPMARHLFLHYPEDPIVPTLRYQYLLGRDWLVAPVLDPGAMSVHVYLPHGRWVHIWTTHVFYGPRWHLIAAPIGQPCVFYLDGSKTGRQFVSNLVQNGLLEVIFVQ